MEILSTLLAFCEGNPHVTGGFPSQRPVTRIFGVFIDLRLDKRLSKQSNYVTVIQERRSYTPVHMYASDQKF